MLASSVGVGVRYATENRLVGDAVWGSTEEGWD